MRLVSGYYQSPEDQGRGSSVNNPSVVFAKFGWRAFSISSVICLLLFTGCVSTDGAAENHRVTSNAVTRHVKQGQEEPEDQIVSSELGYEWFY